MGKGPSQGPGEPWEQSSSSSEPDAPAPESLGTVLPTVSPQLFWRSYGWKALMEKHLI